MKVLKQWLLAFWIPFTGFGQSYTSYLTGNSNDVLTQPLGGICLMGGATENDNAMEWFLTRANGGDVLVLRASGADGYNNYFYSGLGVNVNSVETIVCNNEQASFEPYVLQKIQQAEAIWLAGGDQWNYISYWRNTPVDSLINEAVSSRNVLIGGTSAGMAVLGKYYFSAQNGTVTSNTALNNPYAGTVTVDSTRFLQHALLNNVITDTHFDNPDRKGRLTTFLARIWMDYNAMGRGIACDEYTAVCIDSNGIATVYGDFPTYEDYAYFIQVNCSINNPAPENCSTGSSLTWNHNGQVLNVYKVGGTPNGTGSFSLIDWQTSTGGQWYDWSVINGQFVENTGSPVNCVGDLSENNVFASPCQIFPNPIQETMYLRIGNYGSLDKLTLFDFQGKIVPLKVTGNSQETFAIDCSAIEKGIYWMEMRMVTGELVIERVVKN